MYRKVSWVARAVGSRIAGVFCRFVVRRGGIIVFRERQVIGSFPENGLLL